MNDHVAQDNQSTPLSTVQSNDKHTTPTLEEAVWRSLSLRERVALKNDSPCPEMRHAGDRARRRLATWRAQQPFSDDQQRFDERLAADGSSIEELLALLDEPAERLREHASGPPEWLGETVAAYAESSNGDTEKIGRSTNTASPEGAGNFLTVVEPLIERGRKRLRSEMDRHQQEGIVAVDAAAIEDQLLQALRADLTQVVGRTMVLELNVARLEGTLPGESPEERFQEFIDITADPGWATRFLAEYPVLARQVVTRIDQWTTSNTELLQRLSDDWPRIRDHFELATGIDTLAELTAAMGDRHGDGRTVSVLKFASGLKLVYKPRSIAVDEHFQQLLGWLNARGQQPAFRTLRMVECDDHGWQEFVEHRGCTSDEEVAGFYHRQGGFIALLYVLHAVDFHFENLIAAGEHPVLIDLESLFHPNRWTVGTRSSAPGNTALGDSVLESGLLPRRTFYTDDDTDAGTETSGLSGPAGQLTPYQVPYWESIATDTMYLERRRMAIGEGENRPNVAGEAVNPLDHVDEVVAGFATTYRLLVEHRDELSAPDGPIARFADDPVRYIPRPTATYALTLLESYHPDVMRDAMDRDRIFDRLWADSTSNSALAALCPSERLDLERGDIPLITMRPDQTHMWDSTGRRVDDLLREPVMDSVRRRISQLGESDLTRQMWFIKASFTTLAFGEDRLGWVPRSVTPADTAADTDELISAARAVGDRLELLALGDDDTIDWVGLVLVNERSWSLGPAGADLYNGLWGIGIFYAYLGALTGEDRYTELARRVVTHMREHLPSLDETPADEDEARHQAHTLGIGAFSPGGGAVYALTHLGVLWDDPAMLGEATTLAQRLAPAASEDHEYDIISGAAGYICILLSLYSHTRDEQFRQQAVTSGDHLLANAVRQETGLAWPNPRFGRWPLAGFSHGASGIAHALFRLSEATGQDRFATAAAEAISYERTLLDEAEGNWPDLRELQQPIQDEDGQAPFMTAYCHGAPGVGLARLTALRTSQDPDVRRDLDIAVRTTLRTGFEAGDSLCHGTLGNLELVLSAGEQLGDAELSREGIRLATGLLRTAQSDGWLCGVPGGVETPGLMAGLAGIGYGLLRIAAPDQVPSVLTVDPPPGDAEPH